MSFKPSDYLTDLNIDFNEDLQSHSSDNNDLDLFSQNEFFNLDFKDLNSKAQFSAPTIMVKQEPDVGGDFSMDLGQVAAFNNQFSGLSDDMKIKAANEDKRKRNTAASARFRIKKKLREQQMEARAKELQEKVQQLEKRLMTVETENKCLKKFLMKQNEQKNADLLESIKKRSISDSKPLFEYTK